MTYQTINLGTAPSGAGGDTFRSTGTKVNENFTNNTHAASRYVGTSVGNVMEVGAFGLGGVNDWSNNVNSTDFFNLRGMSVTTADASVLGLGISAGSSVITVGGLNVKETWWQGAMNQLAFCWGQLYLRVAQNNGSFSTFKMIYSEVNTTVDSNGFLKKASPIVKLFADKISANDEASEQNPIFEKVGIGHYLIKNTEGFAKEGWWIEVPTDTNGNRICAVEYQTLENGDLEIKTFKKKLNDEGDIVANLDMPIDIPNNANGDPRWIDVRLHSIAKPVVRKVPRTEKQARMVHQVKYAPQLTYITKYEDLFDDAGNPVIVDGKKYQKPVTHIQTDKNGTPILTNQPVVNDKGETVFEWVQAVDSDGQPISDDVPVLDDNGSPVYDEVTYEPQQ